MPSASGTFAPSRRESSVAATTKYTTNDRDPLKPSLDLKKTAGDGDLEVYAWPARSIVDATVTKRAKLALDGSTASIVTAKVDAAMEGSAINLPPATVTITPTNPSSAKYDEPVTVAVQVRYSDVSWVPMAQYFQPNAMLKASITMRRETVK